MGSVSGLSLASPLAWPIVGLDSNVKDSGRLAGHTMGWCLPSFSALVSWDSLARGHPEAWPRQVVLSSAPQENQVKYQ